MKVWIYPEFESVDKGDGGVRRVVEAQRRFLPGVGVEVVDSPDTADLLVAHIMADHKILRDYPRKPLVAHSHGLYWAEYEWAPWALKANVGCMETIRQATAITAPSEWVAQALRRNTARDITVIGHGIYLEDWKLKPGYRKDGGYVLWNKTRPDPVCDPKDVVELAERAIDIKFISTFGKNLPNMELTDKLPYEEGLSLVKNAAVYLCTSRETFGIGTVEAMAAGVPILAWNWGGQAEFVEHKVTGWLATPGDYDDLEEGLRYCITNRREMGREARRVVQQRFKWEQVIKQYADLYEAVVNEWTAQNDRPKVSVIVPAYGLEEFLPATLDSVTDQSFKDWECVIVDDASPDNCGAIADQYAAKDPRFRVIHNEVNQYLAGALNTGVEAALGQYIVPLDADNLLPRRSLELLTIALNTDRSIHIAYGNVEFLEADGKKWHSGWPPEFRGEWQMSGRNNDKRPANLIPSTSMYRKEVWRQTGGYRRRWKTAEDADFWTRATSYGYRARMITQADTLIYRNRPESMSRDNKWQDWQAWFPWSDVERGIFPPAGACTSEQGPIPSYEPVMVSVVIPVGPGHEEYLIDALDSVEAQTFRLWECIVINDTGKPLRWLPSWVRTFDTKNGPVGVAHARNAGFAVAKGSKVVPLDADDTLEPHAIATMFEIQRQFGGYVYCDWYEKWDGQEEINIWNTVEYSAKALITHGCMHAITALYPRQAWLDVGGFDPELPAWEDWDFQLKLANKGICGTRAPWPLFTYRKSTGKRREENYAEFESSKEAIAAKWRPFFTSEEELMGCRSCGGGGGGKVQQGAQQQIQRGVAPLPETPDGYIMVEYTGRAAGMMSFRAPSGQVYRFSNSPTEKQKAVRREDADYFELRADFAIKKLSAPGK